MSHRISQQKLMEGMRDKLQDKFALLLPKSLLIYMDISSYCISLHFTDTMFSSTLRQAPPPEKD